MFAKQTSSTSSLFFNSVDLFVVGDGLGHRSEAQLLREGALRLLLLPADAAAADGPPDGRVVEETLEPAALPRRRAVINEVFLKLYIIRYQETSRATMIAPH